MYDASFLYAYFTEPLRAQQIPHLEIFKVESLHSIFI